MFDPCAPVYHSAATLRAWAIWRAAHPAWRWLGPAINCGRAGAVLIPLLAIPGATPLLHRAPAVIPYVIPESPHGLIPPVFVSPGLGGFQGGPSGEIRPLGGGIGPGFTEGPGYGVGVLPVAPFPATGVGLSPPPTNVPEGPGVAILISALVALALFRRP